MFRIIGESTWVTKTAAEEVKRLTEDEQDTQVVAEATFDIHKTVCCSVENDQTLVHGSGGRGYGLVTTPISTGTYQWKVRLLIKTAFVITENLSDIVVVCDSE